MKDYKIYYMIIGFLVIMIFIPPIFRFAIPNESNKSNTNSNINTNTKTNTNTNSDNNNSSTNNNSNNTNTTKKVINTLSCTSTSPELIIVTTYESNKIIKIVFTTKYLTEEEESDNSLIKSIVQLKELEGSNYSNNSISFDFTENDYSDESLFEKFNRDINTQKTYYEQLNLSCNITKE